MKDNAKDIIPKMAEEHFENIREQLDKGVIPPKESIKTILLWFGSNRRGWRIKKQIKDALEKNGLKTTPDFNDAGINSSVEFSKNDGETTQPSSLSSNRDKIDYLISTENKIAFVKKGSNINEAITIMLSNDYSQLPVMNSENSKDVNGVVSWKSIGSRLSMNPDFCHDKVENYMDKPFIVNTEDSIFDVISDVIKHDFVLIKGKDKSICGILTASDLSVQFKNLSEPFLLIGEIEFIIRKLIYMKYSLEELSSVKDESDVSDLTFGEYIRLIENKQRWEKLSLNIDRVQFIQILESIRVIRNDLMHFEPDGLTEDDLLTLNKSLKFLRTVDRLKK